MKWTVLSKKTLKSRSDKNITLLCWHLASLELHSGNPQTVMSWVLWYSPLVCFVKCSFYPMQNKWQVGVGSVSIRVPLQQLSLRLASRILSSLNQASSLSCTHQYINWWRGHHCSPLSPLRDMLLNIPLHVYAMFVYRAIACGHPFKGWVMFVKDILQYSG